MGDEQGAKEVMTYNTVVLGISFDKELLKQIERDRGHISRSRYIQILIEEAYSNRTKKEKKS
jgi:metal-responsive CopG/Arc/MetJ family transcriptional regulator